MNKVATAFRYWRTSASEKLHSFYVGKCLQFTESLKKSLIHCFSVKMSIMY